MKLLVITVIDIIMMYATGAIPAYMYNDVYCCSCCCSGATPNSGTSSCSCLPNILGQEDIIALTQYINIGIIDLHNIYCCCQCVVTALYLITVVINKNYDVCYYISA